MNAKIVWIKVIIQKSKRDGKFPTLGCKTGSSPYCFYLSSLMYRSIPYPVRQVAERVRKRNGGRPGLQEKQVQLAVELFRAVDVPISHRVGDDGLK